jgi:hypothetical protein
MPMTHMAMYSTSFRLFIFRFILFSKAVCAGSRLLLCGDSVPVYFLIFFRRHMNKSSFAYINCLIRYFYAIISYDASPLYLQAAAEANQLNVALSPELYADFLLCKVLPLQREEENYFEARKAALMERRIKDVKALEGKRAALGYKSSGISAADMRTRLIALLSGIEDRYSAHVAADDTISCEICVEYEGRIKAMLASDRPTDDTLVTSDFTVSPTVASGRLEEVSLPQCAVAL